MDANPTADSKPVAEAFEVLKKHSPQTIVKLLRDMLVSGKNLVNIMRYLLDGYKWQKSVGLYDLCKLYCDMLGEEPTLTIQGYNMVLYNNPSLNIPFERLPPGAFIVIQFMLFDPPRYFNSYTDPSTAPNNMRYSNCKYNMHILPEDITIACAQLLQYLCIANSTTPAATYSAASNFLLQRTAASPIVWYKESPVYIFKRFCPSSIN
jgi:hypothetical protein